MNHQNAELRVLLSAEDHLVEAMNNLTRATYLTTGETPTERSHRTRFISILLTRVGEELGTLRNYLIERSGRTTGDVVEIRKGLSKAQEAEEAKLRG